MASSGQPTIGCTNGTPGGWRFMVAGFFGPTGKYISTFLAKTIGVGGCTEW